MLDNTKNIAKLDRGKIAASIESLPTQIEQVIDEFQVNKVPSTAKNIDLIVVSGMGGSNLGAGIIKSLFSQSLKQPILVTAGYHVPKFVNNRTLYILSSFSGNTEETLSCYKEAKKQKAKITFITAKSKDNKLRALMAREKVSGIVFDPANNPSGQPRMALGYSIFAMITLFERMGLLRLSSTDLRGTLKGLKERNEIFGIEKLTKNNPAKKMARELYGKIPVLVGSRFLAGNLRAMRNQICENAKNYADYLLIPEMNHFALEGLLRPSATRNLAFTFFDSALYFARNRKRIQLTKDIVRKNKIKVVEYKMTGKTMLDQSFELLQLGSWVSFYLAILNKVDPVKLPYVDWFKTKLK